MAPRPVSVFGGLCQAQQLIAFPFPAGLNDISFAVSLPRTVPEILFALTDQWLELQLQMF